MKIQIHGEVQKQKGTTDGDGASPNINTPAGTAQYTSAAAEGCLNFEAVMNVKIQIHYKVIDCDIHNH